MLKVVGVKIRRLMVSAARWLITLVDWRLVRKRATINDGRERPQEESYQVVLIIIQRCRILIMMIDVQKLVIRHEPALV